MSIRLNDSTTDITIDLDLGGSKLVQGLDIFWVHYASAFVVYASQDGISFISVVPAGRAGGSGWASYPFMSPLYMRYARIVAGRFCWRS